MSAVRKSVKDYYGQVLKSSNDLLTSACTTKGRLPHRFRSLYVPPSVRDTYYGCGHPLVDDVRGQHILDLGCGTGRDSFLFAQLVGPTGRVTGVDMTANQLDIARNSIPDFLQHTSAPLNIEFKQGLIEELHAIQVDDDSIDVAVSNCVLNLTVDKRKALAQVFRVLRAGGEFIVSDVYATTRISDAARQDPIGWGECLGGALYERDFIDYCREAGFRDVRRVSSPSVINVRDTRLKELYGPDTQFLSITHRLVKIEDLDTRCEDYGDTATYNGSKKGDEDVFVLDTAHQFPTGEPVDVCRNTSKMLTTPRNTPYFDVQLGRDHLGPFRAQSAQSTQSTQSVKVSDCC